MHACVDAGKLRTMEESQPQGDWKGKLLGLPLIGPGSLGTIPRRLAGYLIDVLIFMPIIVVYNVTGQPLVLRLTLLVATAVYEIVLIATRGATVGQMVLKLRVVRRSDGQIPGWSPAVRRWALVVAVTVVGSISVIPLGVFAAVNLFGLLDYLWAFWDPNRQCLHDKFADTVVVNTE